MTHFPVVVRDGIVHVFSRTTAAFKFARQDFDSSRIFFVHPHGFSVIGVDKPSATRVAIEILSETGLRPPVRMFAKGEIVWCAANQKGIIKIATSRREAEMALLSWYNDFCMAQIGEGRLTPVKANRIGRQIYYLSLFGIAPSGDGGIEIIQLSRNDQMKLLDDLLQIAEVGL